MPYAVPAAPVVQLALDFLNIDQAVRSAEEAVPAGLTWIEAGTPLIKSEGLEAVRRLRAAFPTATIIADMKVMDAGRTEVEAAKKAGADIVTVLAATTDATLRECVAAGHHVGVAICADLVGVADPAGRARACQDAGVDLVSVHTPIDQQMQGDPGKTLDVLRAVAAAVSIPVACAGGLTALTIGPAVAAGARVLIVGGTITKAPSPRVAAAQILAAAAGAPVVASGGTRVGLDRIREVIAKVSTPNLSDAFHRGGALRGFTNRNPAARLCGPAVTVLAAAGDWSKPVQAIDLCKPGDVLVIDAGDGFPALWGGLASLTAVQRKLGGVVISGACRDLTEITACGLALWSTKACPDAGEPRGVGVINVPVHIGGRDIRPGDWIVGDADGLVAIPAKEIVEVANRAADVAEREERLAAEIRAGRTLAGVAELKKWEQR
jgi:3-hexulose-6-phosphate synthase/6-phospho-3-hexuloisomerase